MKRMPRSFSISQIVLWCLLLVAGALVLVRLRNSPYQDGILFGSSSHLCVDGSGECINVLVIFTQANALGTLALLNSTYSNADAPHLLHFTVLNLDATQRPPRRHFIHSLNLTLATIEIFQVEDLEAHPSLVGVLPYRGFLVKTPTHVLYYAALLFPEKHRIIFLDSDVIVQHDLTPLWTSNMSSFPLAAVETCEPYLRFGRVFSLQRDELSLFKQLGDSCTFNCGVLMLDLRTWRAMSASLLAKNLGGWASLHEKSPLYKYSSQGPLNLVFFDNYLKLDKKWNLHDVVFSHSPSWNTSLTNVPYPATKTALEESAIIQYNGKYKPWFFEGPASERWTQYLPSADILLDKLSPETRLLHAGQRALFSRQHSMWRISGVEYPSQGDLSSREQGTFTIILDARATFFDAASWETLSLCSLTSACESALVLCTGECPSFVCAQLPKTTCVSVSETSSKFASSLHSSTDALLFLTLDATVSILDVLFAFRYWTSHRRQIVGFEPRVVNIGDYVIEMQSQYNVVVSGYFVDSSLAKEFDSSFSPLPGFLLNNPVCEDVALNLFASKKSRLPPMWVQSSSLRRLVDLQFALSSPILPKDMKENCLLPLYKLLDANSFMENDYYVQVLNQEPFLKHVGPHERSCLAMRQVVDSSIFMPVLDRNPCDSL